MCGSPRGGFGNMVCRDRVIAHHVWDAELGGCMQKSPSELRVTMRTTGTAMKSLASARQEELLRVLPCEHILTLTQPTTDHIPSCVRWSH